MSTMDCTDVIEMDCTDVIESRQRPGVRVSLLRCDCLKSELSGNQSAYAEDPHVLVLSSQKRYCALADGLLQLPNLVENLQSVDGA